MVRRDLASSLFWAGVGAVFCLGGLPYGFGGAGVPGGGFLPFLVGLCLVGLSLLQLVLSVTKGRHGFVPAPAGTDGQGKMKAVRVLVVLGALLFYVLAVQWLGFALTSVVFMGIVMSLDVRRWRLVLLASCSFTAFFYILFKVLLRVPLPLGIFGV
jgi:putative tricarboxylic transport membrane protein